MNPPAERLEGELHSPRVVSHHLLKRTADARRRELDATAKRLDLDAGLAHRVEKYKRWRWRYKVVEYRVG